MPFDSMPPEPKHLNFTGARFTESERRQRQRKRAKAWLAEARKADKRPLQDTAILYARWLAERDGRKIPEDAKASCQLAPVTDDDGITRNRVYRVVFTEIWQGRRGHEKPMPPVAEIDIPNWDFVPRVTEFVEI